MKSILYEKHLTYPNLQRSVTGNKLSQPLRFIAAKAEQKGTFVKHASEKQHPQRYNRFIGILLIIKHHDPEEHWAFTPLKCELSAQSLSVMIKAKSFTSILKEDYFSKLISSQSPQAWFNHETELALSQQVIQ